MNVTKSKCEYIYTDMFGYILEVGDTIAYGKSNRDNPIECGKIIEFTDKNIIVKGFNHSKVGKLGLFGHTNGKGEYYKLNRIVLLGDTECRQYNENI